MSRKRIHFGNENKARDFARATNGNFNENKGNTEKPFTVSFDKGRGYQGSGYHEDAHDFNSSINGYGTDWHTAEDL